MEGKHTGVAARRAEFMMQWMIYSNGFASPPTPKTTIIYKAPKGRKIRNKSEISGKIFDFNPKFKELGQIVITIFSGVKNYVF